MGKIMFLRGQRQQKLFHLNQRIAITLVPVHEQDNHHYEFPFLFLMQ